MRKVITIMVFILLLGCSNAEPNQAASDSNPSSIKLEELKNETTIQNQKKSNPQTQTQKTSQETKKPTKDKVVLDVPMINQLPELRYGCEVTSTAMMLQYAGVNVSKMDLYEAVRKDSDPVIVKNGDILSWGDPAEGFVGDMTGKHGNRGYAAFDNVILDLVNQFLPGQGINLTKKPFDEILAHVEKGYPVVIWTTGDYKLPDRWEEWEHHGKQIKTPLDLHVVVLVGYERDYVYINDPLSGKKQAKVNKEQFIKSWEALHERAVSYF